MPAKATGSPGRRRVHGGSPERKQPNKIEQKNAPTIWEPSTKNPDKAIDDAFGLWSDADQSTVDAAQTEKQAQAYRNKLWRSERS